MTNYISYLRVSTKRQNLGIDAQRTMISNYIKSNGGIVLGEYQEKESGKEIQVVIYQDLQGNCSLLEVLG